MKIKEKCVYYNPKKDGYYLVLSIDNKMIYGRTSSFRNPGYLDAYMHQINGDIMFKIDNIILDSNNILNYYHTDKELKDFILVKELADNEFDVISIITSTHYKWPATIIDVEKLKNINVADYTAVIKQKELEVSKLTKEIKSLQKDLFNLITGA